MDYKKFQELLKKGESQTVDFKLTTNAFLKNPNSEKDKAELVKDIIAMANNHKHSYLIYGVGDDKKSFRSVDNDKLNDDNVQILCRRYISPLPKIDVKEYFWKSGSPKLKNIRFIVIHIAPSQDKAFHYSQDIIDYKKYIHFRKNEVWVRHNATSDLASAEEIERLINKNDYLKNDEDDDPEENRLYEELSPTDAKQKILNDISELGKELNFKIVIENNHDIPVIKLKKKTAEFEFRLFLYNLNNFNTRFFVYENYDFNKILKYWLWKYLQINYAFIIISFDKGTKKFANLHINDKFQKNIWGRFYKKENTARGAYDFEQETQINPFYTLFYLENAKNKKQLRLKITQFLELLENDEFYNEFKEIKTHANKFIKWIKKQPKVISHSYSDRFN